MIGKKRSGKYPVYCYDPTTRSKVYVGSREKLAEARTLEAEERVKRKKRGKTTWTVEQFAARWFDVFHGPGTRRPEYTTRKVHEGTLKQLLKDFGPRRLDSIERDEALDWARKQPEGRVKVARAFFNDAIRDSKATENPFEKLGLEQSRGRRDIHPLTEHEVERLADIALERWMDYGVMARAWVTFAAWVGCRPARCSASRGTTSTSRRGPSRSTGSSASTVSTSRSASGPEDHPARTRLPAPSSR
jgi:integrase